MVREELRVLVSEREREWEREREGVREREWVNDSERERERGEEVFRWTRRGTLSQFSNQKRGVELNQIKEFRFFVHRRKIISTFVKNFYLGHWKRRLEEKLVFIIKNHSFWNIKSTHEKNLPATWLGIFFFAFCASRKKKVETIFSNKKKF